MFKLFMSMVWDYVSELWPQMGLLFIPQMVYEYVEPWWSYKKVKLSHNTPMEVCVCGGGGEDV
jgi:hypothetical protein